MRILVLREVPDDRLLREQWDALVQSMEQPEVFYTYEWAISVQRAYGSILRPLLLLGYDHESLVGIAALAVKANGEVGFLAETTADYCDFLSSTDLRQQWCDAIFRELRALHVTQLNLANVPADSVTASVLRNSAGNQGYKTFIRPAYLCARIVFDTDQDRMALRCRTTGKKRFRRNLRLLDQTGRTSFPTQVASEELEPVVTAFCKAHVARFISSGRLSNIIQPERRAFLQELAQQLSQRGWLSINRLLVGDRCIAWNYGFQFGRSWFWYQPAFDPDYERFSPGLCLLGKVVEAACQNPQINVVDLGLGAEGYKDKFANAGRQILHISVVSSSTSHARVVLRHRLAESIKARPRVESRVRAAVSRLNATHSYSRERGLRRSIHLLGEYLRACLVGEQELHFFHWGGDGVGAQGHKVAIRELDQDLLAMAAMDYYADRGTLDYLLRAARRLRMHRNRGFALVTSTGTPVHFCWVAEFESFAMQELHQRLRAPSPNAVLIFDCWTPESMRGRSHLATATAAVARRLSSSGEVPWIFASAQNHASLRGIGKAGFSYQFTMRARRLLGLIRTVEIAHKPIASPALMSTGIRDYAHSEH